MLSKKNLVFKKNQTMVALNVHFYSTQSREFLFIRFIFLCGKGINQGLEMLLTRATPWLRGSSQAT